MEILLVEDDPVSRRVLELRLSRRGHSVDCVGSAEAALDKLSHKTYPMIFLDIGLPGMDGLEMNRRVRANDTDPPTYVLVGTGETGEGRLAEILDAGADDYVAKPYQQSILDTRLAVAEKSIETLREQSRLRRELTFLAAHDPLTGLYNRRQIDAILRESVESGESTVLMQLDLDHFKQINDTFGHQVGDEHLVEISELMRDTLPDSTRLVRLGGDEFVAVVPGATIKEVTHDAEALIERIQNIKIDNGSVSVRSGASIGITLVRSDVLFADLLREADAACYRAKSLGKNCAQVYVPFNSDLFGEAGSADKAAADSDRLELWFQPVCRLSNGTICFHEALLRFVPGAGNPAVDAAMFMAEIYRTENAAALDRFVIREICKALARHPSLTASINISASSICDWDIYKYIERHLAMSGVDGHRLILEVTENRDIPDLPLARSVIDQLSAIGVRAALDDLGAGFTSITTLKHLPIGLVKVDGELVRNLSNDPFNRAFIEALGKLAHGLNFETVAERIETEAEWEETKKLGITYGQGHLLGVARREPYVESELGNAHMFPSNSEE